MHSTRSEPNNFEHRPSVLVVDSCGRCRHDNEVHESTDKVVHTWKCSSKCKPLTEFEVNTILDLKSEFEKPMSELLPILSSCDDGCPNTHYGRVVHETDESGESNVPRKGHSMLCFIDSDFKSRLRILRLASTHYPSLRSFLHAVYGARNSHLKILKLDEGGGPCRVLTGYITAHITNQLKQL